MTLRLATEQAAEAGRSSHSPSVSVRHSFAASNNPRAAGSCVKCGRTEKDTIHAFLDLAHRASVAAHYSMAALAAENGDFEEAARQSQVAARLAREEN